ncbi:MAG: hypothetical protein KA715_03665 [Xanthomonadaceae bacterium]|nr:hypothetical protein [Xanthomonadaceae bacterium]
MSSPVSRQSDIQWIERFFLDEEGNGLLGVGLQSRILSIDTRSPLYIVSPQFTWLQSLNQDYSFVINLRPGLYGDLRGNLSDDFRLEGVFFVDRILSGGWTLGLGAARGSNFGRVLTVPVLHAVYVGESSLLDALLPVKAEYWIMNSEHFEYGAIFSLVGSQYRIEDLTNTADTLQFANGLIGPSARMKIQDKFYIQLDALFTVLRRYEVGLAENLAIQNTQAGPNLRLTMQLRY